MNLVTMFRRLAGIGLAVLVAWGSVNAQTYVGKDACKTCHSAYFDDLQQTLHTKIHLAPDAVSIRGNFAASPISMGASYGNATVEVRTSGGKYYGKLLAPGQTTGPEYEVAYIYGYGWKQRYLVKIDTSYYILPIQWNMKGYLDNSTGTWATYTQATWFNADGSLKPINNTFRTKSWDKNCMGCHVNGYSVQKVATNGNADTSWVGKWGANRADLDMSVGCESCHGPGSGHTSVPSKATIFNPGTDVSNKQAKMEVCGQCHNRARSQGGSHEYPRLEANDTYFNPADSTKVLGTFLDLGRAPNGTGGRGTWADTTVPRQHHQQYHDMLTSKHWSTQFENFTCWTCHDPHKNTTNKHQVLDSLNVTNLATSQKFWVRSKTTDNTFCLSCHAGFGPFAGITRVQVANEPANRAAISASVLSHTKHNTYNPETGLNNCVSCHMTKTAVTALSYDISIHSWGVVSPKKTLDYKTVTTPSKGVINSCSACHRNNVTFGVGTDLTLTDWTEATDVALADTLWKYYQTMFPTTIVAEGDAVPAKFGVEQNYPNPFNPTTDIRFHIAQRSNLKLVVYDITGRAIRTLADGELGAGTYSVTWNSKNDYNEYVATGLYIYRLETPQGAYAKKMVLVK